MADATANMDLPLLLPAQAQKHVTVNDALMRLDGQVDLVLQSVTRSAPPETVVDGMCWGVPAGATNAWEGQGGRIAIGANGGWIFVQPRFGRRAWIADRGVGAIHNGAAWVIGAVSLGQHGSGMIAGQLSEDVTLSAGAAATTAMVIPAGAMVIGVTARVLTAITGTATSWSLGHADALNRFGEGLGKTVGSWSRGILSAPMTYWNPLALRLTAVGGQFAGGRVRVVIHWWELRIPD
ncbi:DUF2793 domain-containing protein [Paracoccus laeviglucosivorans]|uniref:DUF2793 domain-containing protein n=1 Tax=Paracoccus laeviglucosivorans TaxID=1197861 RepID=A0A521CHS9_9RHOB|nr:DUF2793 domain-containing protein [Paracoccus laeviglucosivorans]SMO58999.1 Protein of unknown function [Paracoccus laeviglucosivorans]